MAARKSSPAEETTDREITATRVFDAPRELVFKVWTDPKHIVQWWGPKGFTNTIHKMDVKPGGVWEFVMHGPDGVDYKNKIIYTEVVKPERIVYSHVSGPLFDVTVTFTEQGNKTKLTMQMLFKTAAARNATVKKYGAVEGLNQTLDRLKEHLAKTGSAGGEEFVTIRVFDAPRELMWKVWTEPERLKRWFGPKGFKMPTCKMDLRPGGVFHYGLRSPDGHEMWGKWVFREIVKPEWLVFVVSFSDEKGGITRNPRSANWPLETLSTVTFAEQGGWTAVTVRWVPINATEPERKAFEDGRESMKQGWGGTMDQLAEYLAKA